MWTAATTRPRASWTGAATAFWPGSSSEKAVAKPRRRTRASSSRSGSIVVIVRSVQAGSPFLTRRRTSRSANEASRILPDCDAVQGRRPPGQVGARDHVGSIHLGHRQAAFAVEDGQTDRLAGRPREALQLGPGQRAHVEGLLCPLGQPDDDQAQAVLAGLLVLLHEPAPLERRQEAGRGALVQPELPGELGDARLGREVAEREEEGSGTVDGADGVPIEQLGIQPLCRARQGGPQRRRCRRGIDRNRDREAPPGDGDGLTDDRESRGQAGRLRGVELSGHATGPPGLRQPRLRRSRRSGRPCRLDCAPRR